MLFICEFNSALVSGWSILPTIVGKPIAYCVLFIFIDIISYILIIVKDVSFVLTSVFGGFDPRSILVGDVHKNKDKK